MSREPARRLTQAARSDDANDDEPRGVSPDADVEVEPEVEDTELVPPAEVGEAQAAARAARRDKVLQVARSQIGYRERPNNRTKYGRWYKMNRQPWCAMFVSWVAAKSGAGKAIPRFAYCPSGAAWFRKRRRWGRQPRKGAIVFFKLNSSVINHVGIVEAVHNGGSIVTIEGNTSDAVRRRVRRTGIAGYGYPAYS
jgi:CHAP domain